MKEVSPAIRKVESGPSPIFSGGIAVGLAIGLPAGILFAIGWEVAVGLSPVSNPVEFIGLFAALAALTSSILAFLALSEQRKSRQAGTDPVLIAHFTQRLDARELVMFTVSNVGAGAAMNVRVTARASFDPSQYDLMTNVFAREHPFRTIIHGSSVSFNFGIGFELLGDEPIPPFTVLLEYEDIEGSRYTGEFELNIKELENLGSEKLVETRQALALEEMSKVMRKSEKSIDELLVEVSKLRDTFVQMSFVGSKQQEKDT